MSDRTAFLEHLTRTLTEIEAEGLLKRERLITSAQGAWVTMRGAERKVLNLCANNYLGLADDPALDAPRPSGDGRTTATAWPRSASSAARRTCTGSWRRGWRRSWARTTAILFAACFDANGGLFEPLLGPEDAVISDALNHASIIDGIRLCKAQALPLRQLRHGRPGGAA